MGSNVTKSFRVEDDLVKKLDKDMNFSNIANQALREYLNKSVWLPNFEIEKHAGLSPKKLIKRVENVRYLRSSETAIIFTLYPTSKDEIERNRAIFQYANGNYNALHDGFTYFNVQFPVNLYLFLISREWSKVTKAIHGFLCLLYWGDPEKRIVVEEQLETSTLRDVIRMMNIPVFKKMDQLNKAWIKSNDPVDRASFSKLYLQTMFELDIDPLLFPFIPTILKEIQHPLNLRDNIPSYGSGFEIKLQTGYMRNIYEESDDWHSIVVAGTGKKDDLKRAESMREPWVNWVEEYTYYHYKALKGINTAKLVKTNIAD